MSSESSTRLWTSTTEFGVGLSFTVSCSRANNPLSSATQSGRFAPPGKLITRNGVWAWTSEARLKAAKPSKVRWIIKKSLSRSLARNARTLLRRPGMADGTSRAHASRLVAADATRHSGYSRRFRHGVEVAHRSMTGFALHPGIQMLAMSPRYSRQHRVDAHPRNRLFRFGILRELLDRRPVGDYRGVALHAGRCGRIRHLLTGSRVGVTELARQPHADMGLVTVRQRLFGGRVRREIGLHSRGRGRGRLRLRGAGRQ